MFINQLKIFKMKLIKITQFGFYSGIDSEKYIVTNLEKLVKYINAYLLREYGNYEYADILDQFIWDGYYRIPIRDYRFNPLYISLYRGCCAFRD